MGTMITYHGYNNLMYNAHKNVGMHYTRQSTGTSLPAWKLGVAIFWLLWLMKCMWEEPISITDEASRACVVSFHVCFTLPK